MAPESIGAQEELIRLEVWHTFGASTTDERIFLSAVESFEAAHPGVDVEPVRIPYLQNLQQFINSSQGGEAPDVVRLSDTEIGRIGHISVEACRCWRTCDRTSHRCSARASSRAR